MVMPVLCRYSNLQFMPPTPLPDGFAWPHATGPHPGIISATLGYITLISSRIPLLEYRGCHGITRMCYVAPFGASPEQAREFLRDAKTVTAMAGVIDVLVKLLKRTNRRYQDLVSSEFFVETTAEHTMHCHLEWKARSVPEQSIGDTAKG
jgi:hypothetical protein